MLALIILEKKVLYNEQARQLSPMIEVIKRNSQMTGRKSHWHCISIMIISKAQRAWIFTITIFFYVPWLYRLRLVNKKRLHLNYEIVWDSWNITGWIQYIFFYAIVLYFLRSHEEISLPLNTIDFL